MSDLGYTRRLLEGLLRMPGNIDDVAERMITIAKMHGEGKTVECEYGNVILHARADSTVAEIRRYFESECIRRLAPQNRPIAC